MSSQPSHRRTIIAGAIGNVMEWYDFAVYGFFATVIGPLFFPSDDPTVSLIAAFGAFAAGFLVRPLGGLVFGRIGDLLGRKRALTVSVMAMAVPTVLIGLLPTYATIGIAAPFLIVALRIVQGLSVGGEYTSSLVFLTERAPPNKRAVTGMWGMWGASAGILLGSGVGALVASMVGDEALSTWGWRVPFILGGVIAVAGIVIRSGIHADPQTTTTESPVRDTFTIHFRAVVRVALLNVAFGVGFYTVFVYAVTYIKDIDNLSASVALDLNTATMALLLLLLPLTAWLSDRIGRRPLIIAGCALLVVGSIPFFHLIHSTDPATIFLGEFGFVVAVTLLGGGLVSANVELIPASVRCTGIAFAYNAAIGWLGGTTPLIATWLIATTSDPIAPAYWATAAGAISLLAALFLMKETRHQSLD